MSERHADRKGEKANNYRDPQRRMRHDARLEREPDISKCGKSYDPQHEPKGLSSQKLSHEMGPISHNCRLTVELSDARADA
jgi:hypothetical protein